MEKEPRIALQLMTVKDYVAEHGIIQALKRMSEIGIHYAEMSKIPPVDQLFMDIAAAQKEYGVSVVAYTGLIDLPIAESYEPKPVGEYLDCDYDSIVRHARIIDAKYIRTNMMPRVMREGYDSVMCMSETMNEYGRRLREDGFRYYFHTHHFEFERHQGRYLLDLLLENTDPDYVGIELDVHWAHRGGVDELEWIRKIAGRCELLHLKDFRIKTPRGAKREYPYNRFANIELAEIGDGNLDFPAIIREGIACGSKYLIIEQDETYDRACFDSVALSAENIRRMGFADLF